MSARSRYLEAISPRSGGGEGGLAAPPPPPPPPPPGPPPTKNKAKQQYQQQQPRGDAPQPQAAMMPKQKQDVNATPPDEGDTKVTEPKQESNEHGPATVETEQVAAKGGSPWSPKEEIQSGNVAKFQQLLWGGSQQQQQTTTPTEQQKPKHHATVTSVGVSGVGSSVGTARTVKGGGIVNSASSTSGGNVVMSPHMLPPATPPRHHGSGFPQRSTYNASHNHSTTPTGNSGSNKMTTSSASPKYKRNAPPPLTSAEFPNSSTPTAAATAASSSSAKKTMITTVPAPSLILSSPGRSSARRGGNGGGGLVPTTPTIDHLGTNRGSNHSSSSKATTATMPITTTTTTPMSSSLRQRVGNSLTLTPLDTTFGGNVSGGGGGGDSKGIKTADRTNTTATSSLSSPMQSSVLPPSSTTPRSRIAALTGIFGNTVNTSNGGVSVPSPKTPGTRNTSRDTNSSSNSNNNNNSLIHEAHASATVTGDGIATLTAFKRPNTKVGLVFTRQSSNHPEIAIISQVLPDSIFSRHRLSSSLTPTTTSDASGGGSGNGLEGAEVIAVNGTPVRDPRHAAELVARAVEEVRLTVKRGRGDAENEGRKDVDESEETSNSAVLTSAPLSSPMIAAKQHPLSKRQVSERSQEGVELDEIGSSSVPHVTSMGEESQYSVMTEKDDQMDDSVNVEGSSTRLDTVLKEKSFNISAEPTLDLNTRTESSKSAEIAERRRKAAQAMLLSENLVEDPIGDTAENLFDDADDDYDDEDDWNHQKMDFTSSRPDNLSDPIQIDRMREDAVEVFDDPFITASSSRSSKEGLMASKVTISNPSMALNDLALSTTPKAKATSISSAAPLSTSAADRRRQAALQMYNSSEMVPDNVDDVRLGTIDAVSPPASSKHGRDNATLSSWMKAEPLNEVGRVTSFGSSTSRARTDVTTSSVATARMGGSTRPSPQFGKGNSSLNDFSFSDVAAASALVARTQAIAGTTAPSTTDIKVNGNVYGSSPKVAGESPAAQRRLQRAVERQMSADGVAGAVYGSQRDTNIGENLKSSVPQTTSPNNVNPTARNTISGTTPKSNVRTRNLDDTYEFVDDSPLDVIDSSDADAVLDPILNLASDDSIVEESGKGSAIDDKASADTPRSTRNSLRFGKMTRGRQRGQTAAITPTGYSQVHEEAPRKKMTSIFGVAKLIRKASSKKSKSYKKGITLEDDTNIFDPDSKVDVSQTAVSTRSPSPLSNRSPSSVSLVPKATSAPVVVQREEELAPLPTPPPLIPAPRASDPFDTIPHVADGDDGWGHSDFFKDNSFSSLPFSQDLALGCNVRVDDAFGFPTKSKSDSATGSITRNGLTVNADSDAFFDLAVNGADSWGEPSAMLPVDFTPRKNASAAQHSKDHAENSDALSYDASEMSEVTNPTFASATAIHNALTATKPDPDGDAARRKDEHVKKMGGQLKPQQDLSAPNESAMPLLDISTGEKSDSSIEGKENQRLGGKQFRGDRGENAPTSLASTDTESFVTQKIGDVDSNDNTRLDNDQESTTSIPRVAKSRIMAKYAKSGKVRRANNESLGTIHGSPVDNNKNEPRSPPRSFGGTVSSSSGSSTGSQQQEAKVPSVKKSTSQLSAEPSLGRKNENALVSEQTSVAVQPVRNPKNAQLQPNTHQQGINPATTSSIANRRGRKSPMKQLTSTSGSVSPTRQIETRGSPKRSPTEKYGSNNRKKKVSPSVVDNPAYYSMDSRLGQIKDPIQRAGVRLLWAAAIPIQTQARRFLARQAAIRRMCAVLTIQAFVRRWLAERDLEIAIWSAIQIQSSFRGWFARDSLEDNHYCATQIQRVVRGYLATMHVFEDLYSITIVQSVVRMHLAINVAVDRLSSIIAIQSWWRGMKTRDLIEEMDYSAVAIQAHWRRYRAQMSYQFDIIDVIIVQSVARRWKTRRVLACVRLQCLARVMIAKKRFNEKMSMYVLVTRYTSATMIQARWRSYSAQMKLLHYIAATKIQARWRTYFAEEQYLLERSATKIQSCWRSYTAQVHLLVSVVNVIVIQSLWRRRAAVKLYKPLLHRIRLAKERKRQNSAIIIQSAWRGFVVYSFYLIKRYENKAATKIQASWRGYWQETTYSVMYCAIVKVQALVRGHQDRSWHVFQNNCATIIQASSRRFLVRKEFHNESMVSILIAAAANSLRMRNAATRLQLWWIGELWEKKEKQAALVIERFFIYVKKEVEKEVAALKKKKKDKRRRRKMKQCDDYILERAWLGVANDDVPVASVTPPSLTVAPHRPIDRKMHRRNDFRARGGVIPSVEEDVQSDVSGLTDLDFGVRNSRLKKSQKEFVEDASLEEAFRDSEVQLSNEKKRGGEVVDASRRQRLGYPRRYDR